MLVNRYPKSMDKIIIIVVDLERQCEVGRVAFVNLDIVHSGCQCTSTASELLDSDPT